MGEQTCKVVAWSVMVLLGLAFLLRLLALPALLVASYASGAHSPTVP